MATMVTGNIGELVIITAAGIIGFVFGYIVGKLAEEDKHTIGDELK